MYDLNHFKFIETCLMAQSIICLDKLMIVLYALEKNVHSSVAGYSVLEMPIRSNSSVVPLKSSISFYITDFSGYLFYELLREEH